MVCDVLVAIVWLMFVVALLASSPQRFCLRLFAPTRCSTRIVWRDARRRKNGFSSSGGNFVPTALGLLGWICGTFFSRPSRRVNYCFAAARLLCRPHVSARRKSKVAAAKLKIAFGAARIISAAGKYT
jgi:hypothetical protein